MHFSEDNLEGLLSTLGSNIRIKILDFLGEKSAPVNFKDIEVYVNSKLSEKPSISHHLRSLQDFKLILKEPSNGKYRLTTLGEESLEALGNFKEVLFHSSAKKIRTSRYTLEPFKEEKIVLTLVEEAKMKESIAVQIAKEAKKRLIDAKVEYLTAPLIREYVNAILIERGMEKKRHKLTRLGLPPQDIQDSINSKGFSNPIDLRKNMANSVLEQYTLLNTLSQQFADYFLSGRFLISNIESFTLTPLELVITGDMFIQLIQNYIKNDLIPLNQIKGINYEPFLKLKDKKLSIPSNLVLSAAQEILSQIKKFFPRGLSILNFESFLIPYVEQYSRKELEILMYQAFSKKASNGYDDWGIKLQISTSTNHIYTNELLEIYIESLEYKNSRWNDLPVLQVHISERFKREIARVKEDTKLKKRQKLLLEAIQKHHVNFDCCKVRGKPDAKFMYSNLQVPVFFSSKDSIKPTLLIEKISINLLSLYLDSKKNDLDFWKSLEQAIQQVFNYFEKKLRNLSTNLYRFSQWNQFIENLFDEYTHSKNNLENSKLDLSYGNKFNLICAISYHGLDEVIFAKTNLFIKDQKKNRDLAVKIINFIHNMIEKQNSLEIDNLKYVLSEDNLEKSLVEPRNNTLDKLRPFFEDFNQMQQFSRSYRLGYHHSIKKIRYSHLKQIINEINNSQFNFHNICILKEEKNGVNLEFFKKLMNLKNCGTSIVTISKAGFKSPYYRYKQKYTQKKLFSKKYGKNAYKLIENQKIF